MKFKRLVHYLAELEKTTSRNEMTVILADLLKETDPEEIDKVCYLTLGRLAPLYQGVEFNLAEKMLIKILAAAYQKKPEEIGKEYKKIGDLGEVAEKFDQREKSRPMTVKEAFDHLNEIALESGAGSVERKITKMARLLDDLDGQSAKYVVRIPLTKLRLGFSDLTILDALSWMIAGDKSKRAEIEAAYHLQTDVGQIAKTLKLKGLKGLNKMKIELGIPIMPALCQRLPTAEEMIKKMGQIAIEPKYDGTRLQIHFSRKKKPEKTTDQLDLGFRPQGFIRTFTRNLENTTHMFPDLARTIFKEVKAQEAILDCEAIGYDPKTGKFLPFQETIKRKRKYGIGQKAKEIPLKFFCFDLLFKDGKDLLKLPFSQRRKKLEECLSSKNKMILLSPQVVTKEPKELRRYHNKQREKGLEGVVAKKWEAPYDPGRRGYTWVKLKEEKGKKGGGLTDSLDCVVMGFYRGRGKRAQFGIGAFLVGIKKDNQFLTVSKIGTGLTDKQWREMNQRCERVKIDQKPKNYQVTKSLIPDIWVKPEIVVEIEADNITKSPSHAAEYALRFPRLIRFRDDKSPTQATTLGETKKLYQLQK